MQIKKFSLYKDKDSVCKKVNSYDNNGKKLFLPKIKDPDY